MLSIIQLTGGGGSRIN